MPTQITLNDGHHGYFQPIPRPRMSGWDEDPFLRSYLERHLKSALAPEVWNEFNKMAAELAALSSGPLYDSYVADVLNEPTLTQWSASGRRIDRISLPSHWNIAKQVTAHYGLVRTGYDVKRFATMRRLAQHVLVYLATPSLDMYSCPLAMTDGAAATLLASRNEALIARAVPRLMDPDASTSWTSGQWFTERTGGSDLRPTRTYALPLSGTTGSGSGSSGSGSALGDGNSPPIFATHSIYGTKWFSSAAASEMAIVTARPAKLSSKGSGTASSSSTATSIAWDTSSHGPLGAEYDGAVRLFYAETRGGGVVDPSAAPIEPNTRHMMRPGVATAVDQCVTTDVGRRIATAASAAAADAEPKGLVGIEVNRLKPKLGTKKVPTGELRLTGLPAVALGDDAVGSVQMLVMTRLWNIISAASYGRRAVSLMRSFASERAVFGATLDAKAPYQRNIAGMEATAAAMTALALHTARHCGIAGEGDVDGVVMRADGTYVGVHSRTAVAPATLRSAEVLKVLLPVAKLVTGKQVVAAMSEAIEGFGGAGYVLDTGLPQLLADAQVLPIWEGTSDTLSGTVLRALKGGALTAALSDIKQLLSEVPLTSEAGSVRTACEEALQYLHTTFGDISSGKAGDPELHARDLAMTLGRVWEASILANHTVWTKAAPGASSSSSSSSLVAGFQVSLASAQWLVAEGLKVKSPAASMASLQHLARL